MFSTRASVYLRASTTSVLMIQPSQFNTLPGEVKWPFAYLGKMLPSEEVKSLELVDHTENL